MEAAAGGGGNRVGDDPRPAILITTEEHLVNAAAVVALANDPGIFQRGRRLARVVHLPKPKKNALIKRPEGLLVIDAMPCEVLQDRLAVNVRWLRAAGGKGIREPVAAHPPAWCVKYVHAVGEWENIRYLEGVTTVPVLKPDGTLLITPGYDEDLCLYYEPSGEMPELLSHPSLDDAVAACGELLEVVQDFPFVSKAHKSAWLAALLTPLARFAFAGPAPLFLADANRAGVGKGLLMQVISHILSGLEFATGSYSHDEVEMEKQITAMAMAGDRMVLFDNLVGKFGNGRLNAALTSTCWKGRLLGQEQDLRGSVEHHLVCDWQQHQGGRRYLPPHLPHQDGVSTGEARRRPRLPTSRIEGLGAGGTREAAGGGVDRSAGVLCGGQA